MQRDADGPGTVMSPHRLEILWWANVAGFMLALLMNLMSWVPIDPRPGEVLDLLVFAIQVVAAGPVIWVAVQRRRAQRQAVWRERGGPGPLPPLFPTVPAMAKLLFGLLTALCSVGFVVAFLGQHGGQPVQVDGGYFLLHGSSRTAISAATYIAQSQLQNRIITAEPAWLMALALMFLYCWRNPLQRGPETVSGPR